MRLPGEGNHANSPRCLIMWRASSDFAGQGNLRGLLMLVGRNLAKISDWARAARLGGFQGRLGTRQA